MSRTAVGTRAAARRERQGGWRPDIQGLRAVAVTLVILAHAGLPFFAGGFIGVDVFFVISGYLITLLLLRESDTTGRISLADFYARRARRILPAATVVLLAVLVYGAFRLPTAQLQSTAEDAGWSAVFLVNWHFAAVGTDYFADTAASLLQHYWSLAVEEQFYLVWPLLAMLLVPRIPRRVFSWITAAVLVASLIWSVIITATSPAAAYFNTPARAFELAAGALLACGGGRTLRAPFGALAGVVGGAVLLGATVVFDEGEAFPGWQALVPVAATLALLIAGPSTLTGRLLALRPVRYLGDISFSLYLWHWPVLQIVPTVLPDDAPDWTVTVLGCAVTLALSALSFRFVERAFQRRKIPVLTVGRRSLWLWPVTVSLVLAVSWAGTGYSTAQADAREQEAQQWYQEHGTEQTDETGVPDVPQELRAALEQAESGAPVPPGIDLQGVIDAGWRAGAAGCYADNGGTEAEECVFGDEDAERVIALVGDSHAAMWTEAFDDIGKAAGVQIRLYAKASCAFYPVYQEEGAMSQQECDAFREWTKDRLAQLQPDTIIATARGMLFMADRDGASAEEQWSVAVGDGIEQLRAFSDDVRVLGDVPSRTDDDRPKTDPGKCLTAVDATALGCVTEPEGVEANSNELTAASAEEAGAPYLDATQFVCVDEHCPLIVGDLLVYEDDSHLSGEWMRHIAPAVAAAFAPLGG